MLALGDVATRDVFKVLWREFRVGVTLGGSLGVLSVVLVGFIYGWDVGAVIGLTMLTLCALAASVGGLMPLVAKKLGFDRRSSRTRSSPPSWTRPA